MGEGDPYREATATGLLIVEDHELVRLGLKSLVASGGRRGFAAEVYEAGSIREAIEVYAKHEQKITLVLLDLHLPDAHGLSGLKRFLAEFPQANVVVLSATADPDLMQNAVALGARTYLRKSGKMAELVDELRRLDMRSASTSDDRDSTARGALHGRRVMTVEGEEVSLTPRQAELLDHVLAGYTNREIAETLELAEGTVKNHVSTLLLMFGVRSRAQLISRLR